MSLSVRSKTQTGFKRLARISSPLPPLSTMGPIWQPAQWINQMWQTLHPACKLCHRLLSHACLGLYLGLSQSSPRLLAWFPQLPAGTHFMLAVPLGETKRNWREGNQESSSKSWRSPWPRNLSVPPSSPRKHQSRERAWRKAAAASVARKTSTCPQKRKAGKLKKTAMSVSKSEGVWPSMLGLSWGSWGLPRVG